MAWKGNRGSGGIKPIVTTVSQPKMFSTLIDNYAIYENDYSDFSYVRRKLIPDKETNGVACLTNRLFFLLRYTSNSDYRRIVEYDVDTLLVIKDVDHQANTHYGFGAMSNRLFVVWSNGGREIVELDTSTLLAVNTVTQEFDGGEITGTDTRLFQADDWNEYNIVELDTSTLLAIKTVASDRLLGLGATTTRLFGRGYVSGDGYKFLEYDMDTLLKIDSSDVPHPNFIKFDFTKQNYDFKYLNIDELIEDTQKFDSITYNSNRYGQFIK